MARFFNAQLENPSKGDWCSDILKVMKDVNINMSFLDISKLSKNQFKSLVNRKVKIKALNYLLNIQKTKRKGKYIEYGSFLKMQDYLLPNKFLSFDEQKELFKIRSSMNKIPYNFSQSSKIVFCRKGCLKPESNTHIYNCQNVISSHTLDYNYIYNGTLIQKVNVYRKLKEKMKHFEEEI